MGTAVPPLRPQQNEARGLADPEGAKKRAANREKAQAALSNNSNSLTTPLKVGEMYLNTNVVIVFLRQWQV
jgi:hypothetical protein